LSTRYPDEEGYIELPLGQTAQPYKCGSCFFFGRRTGEPPSYMSAEMRDGTFLNKGGYCKLKLPPQYARKENNPESAPTNWINDDNDCDLWRSSGKTYIEKHKVVLPL
jgi:hypothetical protein